MDEKKKIAARRYASKVCKKYLGIPKKECREVFKKVLIPHMKVGIKAAA